MFKKHKPLYVKHPNNDKPYDSFVVETNDEMNKIKVHYMGFNKCDEEWIENNSDRIITDAINGVSDDVRIALGNIYRINEDTQNIISQYDPSANLAQNEKKLNTIKVDALRAGAEALSIKTVDNNNVRLLKGPLVKLILSAMLTLRPQLRQRAPKASLKRELN